MACIDRQNEIDRLYRDKMNALARQQALREKKKKFKEMLKNGTLGNIIRSVEDKGEPHFKLHLSYNYTCVRIVLQSNFGAMSPIVT